MGLLRVVKRRHTLFHYYYKIKQILFLAPLCALSRVSKISLLLSFSCFLIQVLLLGSTVLHHAESRIFFFFFLVELIRQ
jgi:hypothetical protein